MIDIKNKKQCCGCGSCKLICPVAAIEMNKDEEGFQYPIVNTKICVNCGKCERVCPELNPRELSERSKVFAAYRNDLNLRLKSQSGGVFSVIAEQIISEGGIVFGAGFDQNWIVKHKGINRLENIEFLRGSKYVQSDLEETYKEAEQYLKQGSKVLFSGTPCQIQGLKSYLQQDYEGLFTIDLICHGVSSPEVWNQYLKEYLADKQLHKYCQKDKRRNNAITYTLKDGTEIVEASEDNIYMKGFYKDLFQRPSCHKCGFKGIERCSDITLGDFWGIENYLPEFGDKYGISAVIVHDNKGEKLFQKIEKNLFFRGCETKWLETGNPCLLTSISENEKRKIFFEKCKMNGVIDTIQLLTKPTFKDKLKKKNQYMFELAHAVKRRILK